MDINSKKFVDDVETILEIGLEEYPTYLSISQDSKLIFSGYSNNKIHIW